MGYPRRPCPCQCPCSLDHGCPPPLPPIPTAHSYRPLPPTITDNCLSLYLCSLFFSSPSICFFFPPFSFSLPFCFLPFTLPAYVLLTFTIHYFPFPVSIYLSIDQFIYLSIFLLIPSISYTFNLVSSFLSSPCFLLTSSFFTPCSLFQHPFHILRWKTTTNGLLSFFHSTMQLGNAPPLSLCPSMAINYVSLGGKGREGKGRVWRRWERYGMRWRWEGKRKGKKWLI